MRRHPVGQIINTLREEAEFANIREERDVSPDRTTMQSARVRSKAVLPCRHSEHEGLPQEEACGESALAWRSISDNTTLATSLTSDSGLFGRAHWTSKNETDGVPDLVSWPGHKCSLGGKEELILNDA